MNEKRINARLTPKGDIEANWKKATGFVPLDKEVIIYKPDENHSYSRMKVGDGITEINDLPFLATQDSLPVAYINDDGELIFELGKGITDAYINQQGELEIKVETEEGEKPLVLGKVKGRTPEFRLTEKILEIKYDDETVWSTLVDFSTIASSFDLRLNEETYFLEAQREVDGEWEEMVDLSALKLAHEHSNKDVLDKITSSVFEQVKDAISKRHTHENIDILNQITDEHIENINKSSNIIGIPNSDKLFNHFNIDKNRYPCIFIYIDPNSLRIFINFSDSITHGDTPGAILSGQTLYNASFFLYGNPSKLSEVIDACLVFNGGYTQITPGKCTIPQGSYCYTNVEALFDKYLPLDYTLDVISEMAYNIPSIQGNLSDLTDVVSEMASRPVSGTKQLVEGIFYTDENKKGFSANKNAVPTADSAWIIGEASSYQSLDEAMTSAALKVVTTTQLKSTTTTVTIEIVCVDSDVALWLQTVMNTDSYHTGIVFEDTPDKTYYVKISSTTVSDTTISINFTFIDGQDTFPITEDITRTIQSVYFYPKNGKSSSAEGLETVAAGDYSHVQGKYNEIDAEGKYAHIVGNGTDDWSRSNAHTVDWEGNAWYAGKVTADGIEVLVESDIVPVVENLTVNSATLKIDIEPLKLDAVYRVVVDGVEYERTVNSYTAGGGQFLYYIGNLSLSINVPSTMNTGENFCIIYNTDYNYSTVCVRELGSTLSLYGLWTEKIATDLVSYINSLSTGLTEEQAADLAANTEARHSHENKDVLDTITEQTLIDINSNTEAISTLTSDSKTEGSVEYKIAQAVAAIMENPDDTMNSIQELVTWCNEHAEDAIALNNQVMANKEASHVHENKDVLDTITNDKFLTTAQKLAIDNDTVPFVTELPADAKFGDICRYSRTNEFATDDGGKTIYFNRNWFNEATGLSPMMSRSWTLGNSGGLGLFVDGGNVVEWNLYLNDCGFAVYYRIGDDGTLSFESSRESWYGDSNGRVIITEVPASVQLPEGEYASVENAKLDFVFFYHEPKLMIYLGEWVEWQSDDAVKALEKTVLNYETRITALESVEGLSAIADGETLVLSATLINEIEQMIDESGVLDE